MKIKITNMNLFNTFLTKVAVGMALFLSFSEENRAQCAGSAVGNYPGTPNNCAIRETYTNFAGYPSVDLSKFITGQTAGGTWAFVSSAPTNTSPTEPVGFVAVSGIYTISNATTQDSYVFSYTEPGCATPILITLKPAPDLDMALNTTTTQSCSPSFDLRTLFGANAITINANLSYSPNGASPFVTVSNNYTIKAAKNSGCQSEKLVNVTCSVLPI
ncbi:MAG: hypothetical protein HC817_12880 [Saprospiraceae bacterium]|nr:hypothetical protein [Saprospiraceae bacterium]